MFDKNGSLHVHNKREVNLPCGAVIIQSLCKAYSYELKSSVSWGFAWVVRGEDRAERWGRAAAQWLRAGQLWRREPGGEPEASGGINNQILLWSRAVYQEVPRK